MHGLQCNPRCFAVAVPAASEGQCNEGREFPPAAGPGISPGELEAEWHPLGLMLHTESRIYALSAVCGARLGVMQPCLPCAVPGGHASQFLSDALQAVLATMVGKQPTLYARFRWVETPAPYGTRCAVNTHLTAVTCRKLAAVWPVTQPVPPSHRVPHMLRPLQGAHLCHCAAPGLPLPLRPQHAARGSAAARAARQPWRVGHASGPEAPHAGQ